MMLAKKHLILVDLLIKKTDYNAKVTEIKGKIPSITGLATTAAVNAIKNKIPIISNQVTKNVIMQKYQILSLNILPRLIIINLQTKYIMQR